MIYNIEIYDDNRDLTILLKNISNDFLTTIQDENNINTLFNTKFYMYGLYNKLDILKTTFMITKNSKKNITLLNVS